MCNRESKWLQLHSLYSLYGLRSVRDVSDLHCISSCIGRGSSGSDRSIHDGCDQCGDRCKRSGDEEITMSIPKGDQL